MLITGQAFNPTRPGFYDPTCQRKFFTSGSCTPTNAGAEMVQAKNKETPAYGQEDSFIDNGPCSHIPAACSGEGSETSD